MCMYLFLVYLQSMTASTSVTDSVYQSYQPDNYSELSACISFTEFHSSPFTGSVEVRLIL